MRLRFWHGYTLGGRERWALRGGTAGGGQVRVGLGKTVAAMACCRVVTALAEMEHR